MKFKGQYQTYGVAYLCLVNNDTLTGIIKNKMYVFPTGNLYGPGVRQSKSTKEKHVDSR